MHQELARLVDQHIRPLPGIADIEASLFLDLRYRGLRLSYH
jgi:hypothetical protein